MNTKDKPTKPASKDPVKEVQSHPDGPSLEEMINGEEEKKPETDKGSKNKKPDIWEKPVI